ncbi:MAG: aminotransferase class I/II-fold pyridoxal phosphate-dependent enzyme [Deltaproteobacteria bacterium]|nr:aminotransferase class I/II-fold pyridoxal phosphate-dependent enzyme [Deltaproteobacteria bacterium]
MKTRKNFLPLNRPSIGKTEIANVTACLRSQWITTGPLCKTFEERFQDLTGARHAISLSSATAGMHLTFTALGIGPGDEVITPSLTFASTVNMIALHGARPVFADIHYDTLLMNADDIEARITTRTRAIIPVHFAGAPAEMDRILEIADRHRLAVIEDAAHAVGTRYRGIHTGGFGRTAIFSFHPIKNITTGEGGLITHSDDQLEKKLRLLRFHGIERDAWKRYGKGGNPGYDIETPGWKYNLTDIQAALGIAQLSRLAEFNRRREELVALYREALKGTAGMELPVDPAYPHDHAHHLFVVKILAMERKRFMDKLSDYNIGYGLHFPACHLLKYVKDRFGIVHLPETERAAGKILSLPLFPDMTDGDVAYVCKSVREILGRTKGGGH